MQLLTWNFSLPLLGKELTEQAARKRTYLLRAVYVTVILGWWWWIYTHSLAARISSDPIESRLGRGSELVRWLLVAQFWIMRLILPATMGRAITLEKERDTFGLLLLTGMKPWELVLQKYLSHMLPILMCLSIGWLVMALTYGLGGLSAGAMVLLGILTLGACLELGAVSLLCSVWSRTNLQAVIASYVAGWIVSLMPSSICEVLTVVALVGLYLALAMWLGAYVGLRVRSPERALRWAVFAVIVAGVAFLSLAHWRNYTEDGSVYEHDIAGGPAIVTNLIVCGAAVVGLRCYCLRRADWCLRRES